MQEINFIDCPVCHDKLENPLLGRGLQYFASCKYCGEYEIELIAVMQISKCTSEREQWQRRAAIRNAIRPLTLLQKNWREILDKKRPGVDERAFALLKLFHREVGTSSRYRIDPREPEYRVLGWCYESEEVAFLTDTVLTEDLGYLTKNGITHQVTARGLRWLESGTNQESKQAFVAMWFNETMDLPFANGIAKGIEQANGGYTAFKINDKNHNNKIDDEIVAEIKRSKFLIADFTGHRGGVYYEAGLAQGLGLPVIWTCREDQIKDLHFDIRQYNCITWEVDKLDAFAKAVKDRINATIS
jgi:hypothetical protein